LYRYISAELSEEEKEQERARAEEKAAAARRGAVQAESSYH
jgi:hypothetical protein